MKIGIMGGTFDPIHIGHLILGETAYHECGLDTVFFMPSGNPPHKRHREGRASDSQRRDMVSLAIRDNPHFTLSDREMHSEGYTYTYQTLEAMREENPADELFFILGEDSLADFDKWREPGRICAACTIVAAARNTDGNESLDAHIAYAEKKWNARIHKMQTRNIDISSNMLRDMIACGRPVRYYVPEAVRDYIITNGIYRKPV